MIFQLRGTLLLLISTPVIAALVRSAPLNVWVFVLGASLCFSGLLLRLYSIRRIGKKARVRRSNPRLIVDSGPYGRMRNPLYVANLLMLAGLATCLTQPWVAMLVAGLGFALYSFVICYEEERLRELFGEEFAEYCAAVPRWMPRMRGRRQSDDTAFTWREVLSRESRLIPGITAAVALAAAIRFGWAPLPAWLQSLGPSEAQLTAGAGAAVTLAAAIDCISAELKRRRKQKWDSTPEFLEQPIPGRKPRDESCSSKAV